jgi:hypothetical protein
MEKLPFQFGLKAVFGVKTLLLVCMLIVCMASATPIYIRPDAYPRHEAVERAAVRLTFLKRREARLRELLYRGDHCFPAELLWDAEAKTKEAEMWLRELISP